jgi:hypothetical protein
MDVGACARIRRAFEVLKSEGHNLSVGPIDNPIEYLTREYCELLHDGDKDTLRRFLGRIALSAA